jgi:hypothetical protein
MQGRKTSIAFLRGVTAIKCPIRTLAEFLHVRFAVDGEEYPDPHNEEDW